MNVTFPLMHTCCNRFQAWYKTFPFELETVSSPCIIMGIVPHLLVYWSSDEFPAGLHDIHIASGYVPYSYYTVK